MTGPHPRWEAAARGYRAAGVFVLNCVLVFVFVNVFIGLLLEAPSVPRRLRRAWTPKADAPLQPGQPAANRYRSRYQLDSVDLRAYDGVDPADVETVLDEFGVLESTGFVYEPWVEFSEPQLAGKLVHVDLDQPGFLHRRSVASQNSPTTGDALDVFVFGGSTTFGYNVADAWTFPSYLEGELRRAVASEAPGERIRVTNWGRGFFYSSQEVVLFSTLLRKGYRPRAAFFLDGLNDMGSMQRAGDAPYFTPRTRELWARAQFGSPEHSMAGHFEWLPLLRLAKLLRQLLAPPPKSAAASVNRLDKPGIRALVGSVLSNYEGNRRVARALCGEFGVECFFLWQPVPYYDYDRRLHRKFPQYGDVEQAFDRCWERVQTIPQPPIFLGHLLHEYGPERRVFVDDFHYSPGFNRFMAQRVAAVTGPILGRALDLERERGGAAERRPPSAAP